MQLGHCSASATRDAQWFLLLLNSAITFVPRERLGLMYSFWLILFLLHELRSGVQDTKVWIIDERIISGCLINKACYLYLGEGWFNQRGCKSESGTSSQERFTICVCVCVSASAVASQGQRGQSLHWERGHAPDHHGPPDQVTFTPFHVLFFYTYTYSTYFNLFKSTLCLFVFRNSFVANTEIEMDIKRYYCKAGIKSIQVLHHFCSWISFEIFIYF